MIEIEKKSDNWVATFQGGIIEWDTNLESLLLNLSRRTHEIEEQTEKEENGDYD